MRIVKLAAIAVAAVLGLVLIAAVIVILRFDPNDYKPALTAALEARSGRAVAIDDDIEWSLFPWLAIETGGITVGNHADFGNAPFATIDSLAARVRVWPLLRRQVELGVITVDGLTLDIGTNADGVANWSDLLNRPAIDRDAAPAAPDTDGALAGLEIAGIRLSNGRILWREAGEVRYVIGDVRVTTGPISPGEPVDTSLSLSVLDVASQRRALLEAETVATLANDAVRLTDLSVDARVVDADGDERGVAMLVTETLTVIGGRRIETGAGAIDASAIDPPVGAPTLEGRIEWPSFTADIDTGSARIENVQTTVNGIAATWTLAADGLTETPSFSGSVDIGAAPAESLLTVAGIAAPADLDPSELGTIAGRGNFTADATGTVGIESFTLDWLGMSIRLAGGISADGRVDATVSVPRFMPTGALKALAAGQLPESVSLDEIAALALETRIATAVDPSSAVTVDDLKITVNDASLSGNAQIDRDTGNLRHIGGTVDLNVPSPALLRSVLGEGFPANLEPEAIGPTTLSGRFDYAAGEDTLTVATFDLAAFGLAASGSLTANAVGTAPVVRGSGTLARFDPRATLTRLGQPTPQTSDPAAFASAAFAGDYVIDAAHAEFRNMTLDLDDMRITGLLSVENFEAPSYRFDLTTATLNVDRYLPPASDEAASGERAAGDIALANEPLERLDLTGTARVGALKLANMDFEQVEATLTIADGRAEIAPARTRLYGGEFTGSLAVDTNGEAPTMRLTGNATTVALEPLITALTGDANVRGTGNFELDLTGVGGTITDTLRTATGTMDFSLTAGAVDGFNLGRTLCAAYNLRERLPQPAAAPASTDYTLIRASAEVADGIATSRNLLARTSFMELTGAGGMTLADARVDYDMVATLTAAVPIRGCESMTEFVGDSIPFTIEGPLDGPPDIEPDYRQLIRNRVQEEVRDRIEDRLRERLQDRLR